MTKDEYLCWCCGCDGDAEFNSSCGCSVLSAEAGGNTCITCAGLDD